MEPRVPGRPSPNSSAGALGPHGDTPSARVAKLGQCCPGDASGRASLRHCGARCQKKMQGPLLKKQGEVPLRVHRMLLLPSTGSHSTCHGVFYLLFNVILRKEK